MLVERFPRISFALPCQCVFAGTEVVEGKPSIFSGRRGAKIIARGDCGQGHLDPRQRRAAGCIYDNAADLPFFRGWGRSNVFLLGKGGKRKNDQAGNSKETSHPIHSPVRITSTVTLALPFAESETV